MSVLTDLIYSGSNAVAGLTEGAVNNAIAKYGADKEIAFPDTAYFFPTIYEKQRVHPHPSLPHHLRRYRRKGEDPGRPARLRGRA